MRKGSGRTPSEAFAQLQAGPRPPSRRKPGAGWPPTRAVGALRFRGLLVRAAIASKPLAAGLGPDVERRRTVSGEVGGHGERGEKGENSS